MAIIELMSWPASGLFPVKATGSHAAHEALDSIAGGDEKNVGLCFLPVALYPYDSNPYDPNAVGVMALPSMGAHLLGHLPKGMAIRYRERMRELGAIPQSACDGVISGGWVTAGKQYSYVLELDLQLDSIPTKEPQLTHYSASREATQIGPLKAEGPGLVFRAWVPAGGLEDMSTKRVMHSWSTPKWKTINYYVRHCSGIGLGYQLLAIPKGQHRKWFGNGAARATLEKLDGRWATVRLEKGAPGEKAKWQEKTIVEGERYSRRVDIDYSV